MWADKSLADQNNMMNVCSKKSENIDDIEKQLKEALLQQTESGMVPFSITKKVLSSVMFQVLWPTFTSSYILVTLSL